jgi:putative flippase GtrA
MNIILIPAYEPQDRLISLIEEIKTFWNSYIVVVNDGSNSSYNHIFDAIKTNQVHILTHLKNKGKGAAIKTGIKYIKDSFKEIDFVITCDADGQHLPSDIEKISKITNDYPNHLILGIRNELLNHVPIKSKLGNLFSSFFFFLNTKKRCPDTQTGLRAIPSCLFDDALSIEDNRFDYEMTFLMGVAKSKTPMHYVDIETIYLDQNKSSHFRPIRDSILVYKQPLKFTTIAITSAVIDIGIFSLLIFIFKGSILEIVAYATIIARLISGGYNFLLNRFWSFKSKSHIKKDFVYYGVLYVFQLLMSILFVTILSYIFSTYTLNKLVVDSILFIISYYIQKHFVFNRK